MLTVTRDHWRNEYPAQTTVVRTRTVANGTFSLSHAPARRLEGYYQQWVSRQEPGGRYFISHDTSCRQRHQKRLLGETGSNHITSVNSRHSLVQRYLKSAAN